MDIERPTLMSMDQLQQLVLNLSHQVEQHSQFLTEIQALKQQVETLEKKNEALAKENEALQRKIEAQQKLNFSDTAQAQKSKKNPMQKSSPPTVNPRNLTNNQASNTGKKTATSSSPSASPLWSTVAGTKPFGDSKKVKKASPKHIAAISRGFNVQTGEQGYEYVFMHKSRKFTRAQVRENLRLLGAEPSRILDVCFPARGVLGVLIHVQYKQELLQLFAKHRISVISDFDPLDPKHIADPLYADRDESARANLALELQGARCIRALYYLQQKKKPVKVVAASFVSAGWLSDDDVAKMSSFVNADAYLLDTQSGDESGFIDDDEEY